MNYFIITRLGRQAIRMLEEQDKDEETNMLKFLKGGAATAEQASSITGGNKTNARYLLLQLKGNGWVKEKRSTHL